jgi:SAM-dependent methyltransferase
MKWLDCFIRDLRIRQALPFIHDGDRLLDVGCFDLTMLRLVQPRLKMAVGIDPLATPLTDGNLRVIRGLVGAQGGEHDSRLEPASFDCITMLAVLEHVPDAPGFAREIARLLAPGGRVVITVPDARVDRILAVLHKLRLIHGMSLEEHHGYDVGRTAPIFEAAGLRLAVRSSFEIGLNNLFVFEAPRAASAAAGVVSGSVVHGAAAIAEGSR